MPTTSTRHSLRVPLLIAAMAAMATANACGDEVHGEAETIEPPEGFGAPRSLVYVLSEASATAKHGGHTTTDGSAIVYAYDRATLSHVGHFSVGKGSSEIRTTQDGRLVWIVNTGSNSLTLFDTNTWAISTVPVGVSPVHSFLAPDHNSVWVGNDGSASVSILDLQNLTVTPEIVTGAGHHKMAFALDETNAFSNAYVSNITDATITPVSGWWHVADPNVAGVGPAPHGMDFANSTKRVYNCSGDDAHSIEVIATLNELATSGDETNTIVARIPLPARCSFLHVDEAGVYAYATLPSASLLARIRLSDHQVETFATAMAPDKFAIVEDRAYVVSSLSPVVSVVDLTGVNPTASIAVGNPVDPANVPASNHRSVTFHEGILFVPNEFDDTVSLVDVTTDTLMTTWTDIEGPSDVTVAGAGSGLAYPR